MSIKILIKILINGFLKLFNLKINRITLSNDFYFYIVKTLKNFKIDLLIDVGSNEGQFAKKIIEFGYTNQIISFEPIKSIHKKLYENSKKYKNWTSKRLGFGKINSLKSINISQNSVSSSILQIKKIHTEIEPHSKFVGKEKIRIIKLDNFLNKKKFSKKKIFLKIDTQGYEKNIILGSKKVLKQISCIMLELSLTPLYKNEASFFEMVNLLKKFGFKIWSIERGFADKTTGRVLQVDVIFINNNMKK